MVLGESRANRTLLPVSPTGVVMPPRTAGFGNRDRFELNGKDWIAAGGSNLWRIVVADNPVLLERGATNFRRDKVIKEVYAVRHDRLRARHRYRLPCLTKP